MKANITTFVLSAFAVTSLSVAFVGCNSAPDSSGDSASQTTSSTTSTTGTTPASAGSTTAASSDNKNSTEKGSTGATGAGDSSKPSGSTAMGSGNSSKPASPSKSGSATGSASLASFGAIQPILTANCGCHMGDHPAGKLDLRTYEGLMKGSEDGPVVKAGASKDSALSWAINQTHGVKPMPMRAPKLKDADIKTIDQWIDQGAKK